MRGGAENTNILKAFAVSIAGELMFVRFKVKGKHSLQSLSVQREVLCAKLVLKAGFLPVPAGHLCLPGVVSWGLPAL